MHEDLFRRGWWRGSWFARPARWCTASSCLGAPAVMPGDTGRAARSLHRGMRQSARESRETWEEMSIICTPVPAWPFGSWDSVQYWGKALPSQCLPGQADVTASHGWTATVTGYILISQAHNNFLISACAQTHCACICLQSEVPNTVPVAP